MQIFKADSSEAEAALRAIEKRRVASEQEALRVADDAIVRVRVGGDTFVRRQIALFDGVAIQDILIAPRAVSIDPRIAAPIDMDTLSWRWARAPRRSRPIPAGASCMPAALRLVGNTSPWILRAASALALRMPSESRRYMAPC